MVFSKYRIFIWVFVVLLALCLVLHSSFGLLWEHRPLPSEQIQKGIGYPGAHAYSIPLGTTWMSQNKGRTSASYQVLENGVPLALSNSLHAEIADKGAGRYSLWGGSLYFSSSDNSDPRTNGRKYEIYWPMPVTPIIIWMIYILAIFMTLYYISYYWKNIHKLVYRFSKFQLVMKRLGVAFFSFLFFFVVAFVMMESWMYLVEKRSVDPNSQNGGIINKIAAIPSQWERRDVDVRGASHAYYWHGKLHIHDANGFRRASPFPPRNKQVCRVMLVGDSLTYGYGVAENETYGALLQGKLNRGYDVEILNLGVSGYQSEDIFNVVKSFWNELKPDAVLYGICLNDFLPSGIGEYQNTPAWSIPLPKPLKEFMIKQTRTGSYLDKAYNDFLIKTGGRADFFTDILRNFGDYQTRFAKDVSNMNAFTRQQGGMDVVGVVLDQYPDVTGKGYQIAKIAERAMNDAGMQLIHMGNYYRTYSGKVMAVSLWEGHPNADAHAIFAEIIYQAIKDADWLQPFKRMNQTMPPQSPPAKQEE